MYEEEGVYNLVHDLIEQLEKLITLVCKTREIGNHAKLREAVQLNASTVEKNE